MPPVRKAPPVAVQTAPADRRGVDNTDDYGGMPGDGILQQPCQSVYERGFPEALPLV